MRRPQIESLRIHVLPNDWTLTPCVLAFFLTIGRPAHDNYSQQRDDVRLLSPISGVFCLFARGLIFFLLFVLRTKDY